MVSWSQGADSTPEGKKLTTTGKHGTMYHFFWGAFLRIFKNFHVRLGKKSKNVSFYKGVCMCKAKLTLVSFFLDFFFVHLSLREVCYLAERDLSPKTVLLL